MSEPAPLECRAGVIESAFLIEDMTVEIIADGAHLPAPLLKLIYRFKGADRIALVTDSMRAAGMPEGPSLLGSRKNGQPVIVEEGVAKLPDRMAFAGSVATADRLVRTMTTLADIPLWEAVRMMTLTPLPSWEWKKRLVRWIQGNGRIWCCSTMISASTGHGWVDVRSMQYRLLLPTPACFQPTRALSFHLSCQSLPGSQKSSVPANQSP